MNTLKGGENMFYNSRLNFYIDFKTGKMLTLNQYKNLIRKNKLKKINDIKYN